MAWSAQPGVRIPPRIRARVIRRDEGMCQLRLPGCLGEGTHVDHKVNIAALGINRAHSYNDLDNLQLACAPCHQQKTAGEAVVGRKRSRSRGLRQPERPPGLRW